MCILGLDVTDSKLCVCANECTIGDSYGHASVGDEVIVMRFCTLSVAPSRFLKIMYSSFYDLTTVFLYLNSA
jgi:acetyltransferase-like isoleucine patch superfamily enzyme